MWAITASLLESGVGRVRISLDGQRFRLDLLGAPDGDHFVGDVGDIIGRGDERADVFVTLAYRESRPVLYWRETYQHRSFRQGILNVEPDAVNANWNRLLAPLCEGTGGVDISH